MKPAMRAHDIVVQEIVIQRSADKVFAALTSPEALVQWWGVAGKFRVTQMESDLRPGGKWRMHLVGGAGAETSVTGVYRDVRPPNFLTYTWIREQDGPHESLVRWDLEETDGATLVRVTHSGLNTPELRARNDGWPLVLGLLKMYAEDQTKRRAV